MPFDIATSMEPASSGVNVEAPPSVYNTSMSRPASLKKPCFSAMSTKVLSQKPRCATATFRVSASALDAKRNGDQARAAARMSCACSPPGVLVADEPSWADRSYSNPNDLKHSLDDGLVRNARNARAGSAAASFGIAPA